MSSSNRVFITGLSALTACGATLQNTWDAVLTGQTGIDEIKEWDISTWPARLGAELKAFQPAKLLPDRKLLKVISRQDVMGIHAAIQAVEHSGIVEYRNTLKNSDDFNERTGVYVGSPGNKYFQQYDFLPLLAKAENNMQTFSAHLFEEIHPMWLLRILPNNVLAYAGITYGFKGPNHNIVNHAVGGVQAMLEAAHAIRSGQADRVVVVAYDMGIEPQALFYYYKLGVISETALKPFDVNHNGTILGEGAAAIILESEQSAKQRSARCFAEILGGASTTEGTHLFSIEDDGKLLSNLLHKTLADTGLTPNDVGMITAHGNGNKKSDKTEALAITNILQDVPVTAFKWAIGHTICASGLIDSVLTVQALNQKIIPGIANFTQLAENCRGLNVQQQHSPLPSKKSALVINRGFAGMNACLVMQSCD